MNQTTQHYFVIILTICFFFLNYTTIFSQDECVFPVPTTYPNPSGVQTSMDEIVARIVYAEIGIFASDDEDVLKAQAVAARTKIIDYGTNPNPLSNGVVAYHSGNYNSVPQVIKNAALSTTNEILLYDELPIKAEFASRCNGDRTLSYKNGVYSNCAVNTVNGPLPYLLSVECSGHTPCSSGSACCTVNPYPPTGGVGKVFGHGVGLCQYGARDLANNGISYYGILNRYYPNTCLANSDFIPVPIPVFVSNQDFTPNCDGLNIYQASSTLLVNNLVVENIGDALSSDYTIHYYLSSDNNISNAIYLGQQVQGAIDAFSAETIPSTALAIPAINAGQYYLMVYVVSDWLDGATGLIEYDLNNNICSSSQITIQVNQSNTLNCSNITPINCGTVYNGITHFGTPDVSSYSCNSWNETGPENIFSITPTVSGLMNVILSNTVEIGTGNFADLDIFVLSSCNANSCIAAYNSSGSVSVTANTTYYIVVDGRNGASGSYQLQVNCPSSGGSSLNCADAIPFTCVADYNNTTGDYEYSSSTVVGSYDASTYGCQPSWNESGPEIIFEFTPDYNDNIVLTLSNMINPVTGAAVDLDAFVLNSCNPNDCILAIDAGAGILQNAVAGQTYYVVVDGYSGAAGNYDLAISGNAFTSSNPNNNTSIDCSSAIPITCGTSISGSTVYGSNNICKYNCAPYWPMTGREVVYSFTAQYDGYIDVILSNETDPVTGGPAQLEVFVLDLCNQNFCALAVFPGNTSMYAYEGSTYYIVVDGYFGDVGNFELLVQCQDIVDLYSQNCITPFLNDNVLSVNYDISNNGNLSANNFSIQWYIIDQNETVGIPLSSTSLNSNIPGNSYNPFNSIILDNDLNQTMQSQNLISGNYKIGMFIDVFDEISEIIEFNNSCISSSSFYYDESLFNNCEDLELSGLWNSVEEFHGLNYIISPNPNNPSAIVQSNADISFKAGQYISLNPGFEVQMNASFSALIELCE